MRTYKLSSTCILIALQQVENSYQLQRVYCLLAAVHAANECVKTAQLEEGGKGKDRTIELSSDKWTETRLYYTYRKTLAGFTLTHFCMTCLVSTLTEMDSISN